MSAAIRRLRHSRAEVTDGDVSALDTRLTWLADTTSVLAHAETYLLMRETLQATPKRYQSWLASTWRRMAAAATQK
jgi:hypothetical protein